MTSVDIPRSIAAPLVLAVAIAGTFAALFALADQAASLRSEREAKLDLLGRLGERASRLGATPAGARAMHDLVAASETLAAASLDARLRQLAQAQTLTIVETRPESIRDTQGGKAERVSVHAVVQGRIAQVQALLYALETGDPRTAIDDVELTIAAEGSATAADPQINGVFTASARWRLP